VLEFAAEHRLVLLTHIAALLQVTPEVAGKRLRALRRAGLLRDGRGSEWAPGCDQITRAGLRAIGSSLPSPRPSDPGGYLHNVGLAWLWLAARAGVFGALRRVVSEREMRSSDGRAADGAPRFAVRLGGVGPAGRERLHYPDLIVEAETGHRVALELELSLKSRQRREGILAGYAADPSVDAVLYLVDQPSVARAIEQSAARVGISRLVHVRRVSFAEPGKDTGREPSATRTRRGELESPARAAVASGQANEGVAR
jgi:hypothetical protein